jgi:hypothetical protein
MFIIRRIDPTFVTKNDLGFSPENSYPKFYDFFSQDKSYPRFYDWKWQSFSPGELVPTMYDWKWRVFFFLRRTRPQYFMTEEKSKFFHRRTRIQDFVTENDIFFSEKSYPIFYDWKWPFFFHRNSYLWFCDLK